MFSTFRLVYPSFLHLKNIFIPVLGIAGKNGAVVSHFLQVMKYDIEKTCKSAPPRSIITLLMLVMNIESRNKHFRQIRALCH